MGITVETKYLDRRGWPRALKTDFSWMELETPSLSGVAGLLQIHKVTSPGVIVNHLDRPTVIADDGYSWMSIAPRGENWWLTTMYDRRGQLVQHYFDITRSNTMDGPDSRFEDLMLDVVVTPDGACELWDMDELDEALAAGNITQAEHELACRAAQELLEALPQRTGELNEFCRRIREELLGCELA